MTSELARDPASLVFIRLADTLRERGQLETAKKVVRAGLERYPDSSEAHDLHARILVESGDMEGAAREWDLVLKVDPRHLGAHKGLGFIWFRQGDLEKALDHLELALSVDPTDQSVVQALRNVRATADGLAAEAAAAAPVPQMPSGFSDSEGAERGLLLVDPRGRVLGGSLKNPQGADVADAVAALLAGVSQEADRTARMLEIGGWVSIVAEAGDGNLFLSQPAEKTVLLLARDKTVPPGRLAVLAEKAAEQARVWLKEQST
jgi:Tfp pilus assembly protein PilF/predicted regulator of Ras-like GTPase activity (Roadblock/LC7/MglB family)